MPIEPIVRFPLWRSAGPARQAAPTRANGAPGPRAGAALDAWFARQAGREARTVYLEEALLTGEFGPYARYRLRYFFLRHLLEAVLHLVRVLLLYAIFSASSFVHLVLVTAVAGLLGSFWWGALEGLRARVRERFRDAKTHLVPGEISRWLGLAAIISTVLVLLPVGWIAWDVGHAGAEFSVLHLYLLAVGLRLALDLPTLTFHSGIYAVRRIYRPLPAIVTLELVGFLVVLALWPWLGPWCFPVAMLAGTFASTAVLLHYTARLYRFFGFLPLPAPAGLGWPRWSAIREFFAAGAAHALMKLDAFLVLALLHANPRRGEMVQLFVLFFGISPAVRAGFDWAHLFYFDLKRLEVRAFANLKRRYDRFLVGLSVKMGILIWGLACLFGTLAVQQPLGALYWLLGPFFVSRSALALVQIRAFSERRYAELLGSGVLLLAGIGALRVWVGDGRHRLAVLIVLTTLVVALLRVRQGGARAQPGASTIRPLPEWLAELGGVSGTVLVRSARLWTPPGRRRQGAAPARETRWRQRQIAKRIARHLGPRGAVTTIRPDWVTWYERSPNGSNPDEAWLLALGGGFLQWVGSTGPQNDGLTALAVARRRRLLDPGLYPGRHARGGRRAPDNLRRSFLAIVPDGVVYAPDQPAPELFRALSSKEKRQILLDAAYFVSELRVNPTPSRFEVTAFAADGEIKLVFLVSRAVDPRVRGRWARLIRSAILESALPPVAAAQGDRSGGTLS